MSRKRTACPELEQLAAFIDGGLEGEERQEIVEHLESCATCYALYTDTIQLQEEDMPSTAEPAAAPVVEHPSSHARRWWLAAAVAAIALLAAGAVYWLAPLGPPQPFAAATLAEHAVRGEIETASLVPLDRKWPQTRDADNPKGFLTPEQRWFQLGVESVALAAALGVGNDEAAHEHLEVEILPLLDSLDFGQLLARAYSSLQQELVAGASREQLLMTAAAVESLLVDAAADQVSYYSLGQWAEAGRLAAVSGEGAYFKQRSVRRYPERLATVELSPELRREVATLEGLLKVPSQERDLVALTTAFERVIDVGGG